MSDIFNKSKRSQIMSNISGKETLSEIKVRSYLFKYGFRFRKNVKSLPGTPDIVLPKFKTVIFINGCFWHGHANCKKSKLPLTNHEFWKSKIQSNVVRDLRVEQTLKNNGWKVIVLWQCELSNRNNFPITLQKLIRNIKENSY